MRSGPKLPYLGILPKKYVLGHILMKLDHAIVIEGFLEAQGVKLSFEIIYIQNNSFLGGTWVKITIFGHFAQKIRFESYLDETWSSDSD